MHSLFKEKRKSECEQVQRLLSERQDGALGSQEEKFLENHIKNCFDCRQVQTDFERIGTALHLFPEVEPSSDFKARFWQRVEEDQRTVLQTEEGESSWLEVWLDWGKYFLQKPATALVVVVLALIMGTGVSLYWAHGQVRSLRLSSGSSLIEWVIRSPFFGEDI